MSEFLRNLVDEMKDEDTNIASDGNGAAEFHSFIDTGSYMLNAGMSGSLYGGFADNKVIALAGAESVGKTYIALSLVKSFQQQFPNSGVVYYDTEASVTKSMMEERGIDTTRVIISEPDTVEKFKTHCLQMIEKYHAVKSKTKPRMMMVLDSLGMLPTNKELEDSTEGKNVRDMTRAMAIRSAFRTLTLKLARAQIPFILTNHTYDVVGSHYPQKEMSGGGGVKYAASSIIFLSKAKERDSKDDTQIVGNIITATMNKSRLSVENKKTKFRLMYDSGLERYYGLIDLGIKYGYFKKMTRGFEWPGGEIAPTANKIYSEPEKWFTPEVMAKLEEFAKAEFTYGSGQGEKPAVVVEDALGTPD